MSNVTIESAPQVENLAPTTRSRWGAMLLGSALLVIGCLIAFWPVTHNGFTTYDDPDYITQNDYVQQGLTLDSIKWAFTNTQQSANWHPLTWLSHMLDVELFGATNAPAQHWMSVGIHTAASIVLFIALVWMTQSIGCSWFVAALFALHPLRVESVAWAAERKDVLSGLFWMLTMLAYAGYVKKRSWARYALVFLAMAVGLLAKPMLVTLPLALLLLDLWPLKRFGSEPMRRLLLEKVPLFVLSVAASIVTVLAQRSGQAVGDLKAYPLGLRIENAIVSYVAYILKTFWPLDLSPFYPHPGMRANPSIPMWQVIGSLVILLLVTLAVIALIRRAPYLFVGWFWYIVTLVPVIGIVQVGKQAMADRYMYIPSIGLYVILAWGAYEVIAHRGAQLAHWILATASFIIIVLCIIGTNHQTRFWKNDFTLWSHALAIDPQNFLAYDMIGNWYLKQGDGKRAMAEYSAAQQARPEAREHEHDMAGNVYAAQGDLSRAQAEYERAVQLQPNLPETHNNLGQIYAQKGEAAKAIQQFRLAIQYGPMIAQPYHNLALELAKQGDIDQAIPYWQKALELKPAYAAAHEGLGHALRIKGDRVGAAQHYRAALKYGPQRVEVMGPLAWILATDPRPEISDPTEALRLAKKCNEMDQGKDPLILDTLAAAQARAGKFNDAIATAQQAEKIARSAGHQQLANGIQSRIMLYQQHQPYIEAPRR